jgi:hypothetical protein
MEKEILFLFLCPSRGDMPRRHAKPAKEALRRTRAID